MTPFLDKHGTVSKPLIQHLCCDVCSTECKCSTCYRVASERSKQVQAVASESKSSPLHSCRSKLNEATQIKLRQDILQHRLSKISSDGQCTVSAQISTIELLTTITDDMIDIIMKNYNFIFSHVDVSKLCPSLSRNDAVAISDIIDTYYH